MPRANRRRALKWLGPIVTSLALGAWVAGGWWVAVWKWRMNRRLWFVTCGASSLAAGRVDYPGPQSGRCQRLGPGVGTFNGWRQTLRAGGGPGSNSSVFPVGQELPGLTLA